MNVVLLLLAFVLGILTADLIRVVEHIIRRHHHRRRIRLHLTIEAPMTINVGQTATANIKPTDASGNPAPVTNVVYDVTPAGAYTIVPAADGLSAVYTAVVAGTGNQATVTATASDGSSLKDAAALPDVVVPVPVATALNLSVTTP